MPRNRDTSMEATRAVIEEIFDHPPVSEAELSRRISSIDVAGGRRILAERLQRCLVGEEELGLFLEVFRRLGLGDERERLARITAAKHYDTLTRTVAMTLLAEEDPASLDAGIRSLDPEDIAKMADRPLIELLNNIECDPEAAREISEFLLESPREMREFLLHRLGVCRREIGVSAVAAYGHALSREELASLHAPMIDAVVEEGGAHGLELLTRLRDRAAGSESRKRFQAALMRLGTRYIDPKRGANFPAGSAYVGSCDGQGAFVLLSVFDRPNRAYTAAHLCIRAAADVRDGFVITRQSAKEVRTLLDEISDSSGCEFASVSLDQAIWLAAEAVDRTRALKVGVPKDAIPAVNLLRPLFEEGLKLKPTVEPSKRASLGQVRRLLKRPIYRHWFFDIGDLAGANITPPAQSKVPDKWYKNAARKLDKLPIRGRLAAMARHMAHWHAWRGESEPAALCAAVALATEQDFSDSPLVRVMLERTLATDLYEDISEVKRYGAPDVRQYLKSKFFQELKAPTGKDLALLDFTEAALSCLDSALAVLPGERRPRDDRKPGIALTIAKSYRDLVLSNRTVNVDKYMRSMLKELEKRYGFNKRECREIGAMVVYELTRFSDEVCSECHVRCVSNPAADTSEFFFSPHHPIDLAEDEDERDQGEQLELEDLWGEPEAKPPGRARRKPPEPDA